MDAIQSTADMEVQSPKDDKSAGDDTQWSGALACGI